MSYKEILKLLNNTKDNVEKGVIVSSGYVFVFIDLEKLIMMFDLKYSSKLSNIGLSRNIYEKWKEEKLDLFRYEKIDSLKNVAF